MSESTVFNQTGKSTDKSTDKSSDTSSDKDSNKRNFKSGNIWAALGSDEDM
jgi:hypothetical protein